METERVISLPQFQFPSLSASFILLENGTWWDNINENVYWQERIFIGLSIAYAFIGIIALVQLIRIQRRVPEYGWTTQKVFHLLNFFVNSIRAAVFFFRIDVQTIFSEIGVTIILDLPGLLFFSTYTLLVLFWAEIYHQARGLPTENLRPSFIITNSIIYVVQFAIWGYMWAEPTDFSTVDKLSKFFFAGVSLAAAIGFLLYGGRLFLMLRRFPIESRGRRKKLHEVGYVTGICFICFTARSIIMAISAVNKTVNLDVLDHPVLNAIYYTLVELLPSALVLYILRKLPPKRVINTQPIC